MPFSEASSWRRMRCCILATSALAAAKAGFEGPTAGDVEIEFAPMDIDVSDMRAADPFMDLLAGGGSARRGGAGIHGPAKGGREAELDNVLANVLGGFMSPDMGRMAANSRMDNSRGGMPAVTEEVVLEGPGGTQVMMSGGGGPGKMGGKSSLSAGLIRDLFPGAMLSPGPVIIEGPGGGPGPGRSPFGSDPMMMDIMQDLDRSFSQEMLPAIRKAASGERDPASCQEDVRKYCTGATSHLHCLGANHDSISEACRKEVGKSVPYRCSQAISNFCDVLQSGILSCLYDHMDGLDDQCRDAVLSTKHAINKVNTQQTSFIDPSSGIKKVSAPAANAAIGKDGTAIQKEAKLDAKLGLAKSLPAPGSAAAMLPMGGTSAQAAEASLDAKLGLSPTVSTEAERRLAEAEVAAAEHVESATGALAHFHGFFGFVCMGLVVLAIYLAVFTDYTKKVQARLQGHEGRTPLMGTELPRPDAL